MSPRRLSVAIVLAICAALLPGDAHAQRGGRGGGGMGGRGGIGGGGDAPAEGRGPAARAPRPEAPPVDVVALVLEHGRDLALADSQVARLTAVKARQDSAVAPLRARLDSVGPMRGGAFGGAGAGGPSAVDRDAFFAAVRERQAVMKEYRSVLGRGRGEALALLDKKQRKREKKLESAAKKDAEAMVRSPNGRPGEGFGGGERRR